ncbi:hypothetical protein HOLleu_04698 [Holothuria leucospilota]|uniref:Uncharacterized protein n=1 Tax=Holothuria leucospilota TaxID=206669 RepID=A0A9Q1CUD0_HOLLE|nr:hypothetical protein HOLleu_04698 [Holothuria leucospilota]
MHCELTNSWLLSVVAYFKMHSCYDNCSQTSQTRRSSTLCPKKLKRVQVDMERADNHAVNTTGNSQQNLISGTSKNWKDRVKFWKNTKTDTNKQKESQVNSIQLDQTPDTNRKDENQDIKKYDQTQDIHLVLDRNGEESSLAISNQVETISVSGNQVEETPGTSSSWKDRVKFWTNRNRKPDIDKENQTQEDNNGEKLTPDRSGEELTPVNYNQLDQTAAEILAPLLAEQLAPLIVRNDIVLVPVSKDKAGDIVRNDIILVPVNKDKAEGIAGLAELFQDGFIPSLDDKTRRWLAREPECVETWEKYLKVSRRGPKDKPKTCQVHEEIGIPTGNTVNADGRSNKGQVIQKNPSNENNESRA